MAGTKRLKSWFIATTSTKDRFRNKDIPTQATLEDLLASSTFPTETTDKAKVSSGATIGSEQGLTVLASDTQAKANTVQLTDRSLVTQPHQLPTVISETQTITGYNSGNPDTAVEVSVDGTTTRNQYIAKFKANFITYLNTLYNQVATNVTNIGTLTTTVSELVSSIGNAIITGSNVGAGTGIFYAKNGTTLEFKSLFANTKKDSSIFGSGLNVLTVAASGTNVTYSLNYAALSNLQDEQYVYVAADTAIDPYDFGDVIPTASDIDDFVNLTDTSAGMFITPKNYSTIIPDVTSVIYKVEFIGTFRNPNAGVLSCSLISAITYTDYDSLTPDPYVFQSVECLPTTLAANTATISNIGTLTVSGTGSRNITVKLGKNNTNNGNLYGAFLSIRAISLTSTSLGTIKIV